MQVLKSAVKVATFLSVRFNCAQTSDGQIPTTPPVIDISSIFAGEEAAAARYLTKLEIFDALNTYGLFIATGHNISKQLWDDSLAQSGLLFNLSLEEKLEMSLEKISASQNKFGRGYLPFGQESGTSKYFEPKEGYSYGYPRRHPRDSYDAGGLNNATDTDHVVPNALSGTNEWPEKLSTLTTDTFGDVFIEMAKTASAIVYSQDATNELHKYLEGGERISLMRIFHYFSRSTATKYPPIRKEGKEALGSSPHTDWGLLTVILQDSVGGLQFFHKGEWRDVPVVPMGLVINGGDYLRLASGDQFISPIHRVQCPPEGTERTSFVLFFYPNYDAPLSFSNTNTHKETTEDTQKGAAAVQSELSTERYNSLMINPDGDGEGEVGDVSTGTGGGTRINVSGEERFGDFIMKKWRGVTRS